jgi:hypothetical protein
VTLKLIFISLDFFYILPGSGYAFIFKLDPDTRSFSKLDPDPHSLKKLEQDPHKVDVDTKHCLGTVADATKFCPIIFYSTVEHKFKQFNYFFLIVLKNFTGTTLINHLTILPCTSTLNTAGRIPIFGKFKNRISSRTFDLTFNYQ